MIPKEVLKKVHQIEIRTTGIVNSVLAGAYSSSFKGQGMEFAEVREYVPGDEIRSIDWNVTARHGTPYIKKFTEERELTVILVVDASSSWVYLASLGYIIGLFWATLRALLAYAATIHHDRVGLLIFTSQVEMYIPPKKGRRHVLRVIRELLYFKPKERGTNLALALEYLNKILNRRAVVFVVSDFATGDFEKPIKALMRKHDGVAITVWDPREREMPDVGFIELEDAETGEIILVDTGDEEFRRTFKKEAQKESSLLKRMFRKLRIDFVEIVIQEKYDDTIHPLLEYFRKRASKIR